MSDRLQVLIPEELHRRIAKAAQRRGISTGELARWALEAALRSSVQVVEGRDRDPLDQLGSLSAPTGDVEEMLAQIDAGRA